MFENCGSCFAAEQFVDIRLGAKYLLTLTSYYYEREWKFMAMITLQNSRNAEVTVLTNNFIDNYMPGANGEFVKVYIYLLRLLSDTSVPFSLEQMADHFFCTERDIIRALKYWEKEKLLTLTYRNNEDIADIILNVPPVKSAASDTPVSAAPVTKTETQTSSAPAQPVKQTTRSATALSPDRVKELKQNDEIVQLLYIAEQYLGKTLTPTEMKKILFFYDELKFSPDLIEYLIEYSVSRGHKSMRYIETVALAWADEGITTVTMAKEANSRYTKEFVDREDYFTLAFFGEEHREALNLCGRVSGRDEDKIKEAGLTPYYVDGTVAFEEAKMIFVCKKVYVQRMGEENFVEKANLDKWYADKDMHNMYMGEIKKILVKED